MGEEAVLSTRVRQTPITIDRGRSFQRPPPASCSRDWACCLCVMGKQLHQHRLF